MLAVLNLGISNMSSVLNALEYLNIEHVVSNSRHDIEKATHLILPGVGTFEAGMAALTKNQLDEAIREVALVRKKPVLGICLGMQLLFEKSSESPGVMGLNILPGKVEKLRKSADYTLPRIGWCESEFSSGFLGFEKSEQVDFYYIHGYQVVPDDPSLVAIVSGEQDKVTSAVWADNVYGVQFHPEKSHKAGLRILQRFANIQS